MRRAAGERQGRDSWRIGGGFDLAELAYTAPVKPRPKQPSREDRFDASQLTAEHHELLAAFQRRRDGHDRALADSNIIYHKHTCPVCGFPTLDERVAYEVCIVCLWEDDGDPRDLTRIGPPNYTSMLQERVNIAGMLECFERTREISDSLHDVIMSIRDFEARRSRGDTALDRDDFAANLRNILPTRARS